MMGKKGTVCPTHDPDTKRIRALSPNLTRTVRPQGVTKMLLAWVQDMAIQPKIPPIAHFPLQTKIWLMIYKVHQ